MKTGAAILGFVVTGLFGLVVGYAVGVQERGPSDDPGSVAKKPPTPSAPAAPGKPAPGGDENVIKVPVGSAPTKGPATNAATFSGPC